MRSMIHGSWMRVAALAAAMAVMPLVAAAQTPPATGATAAKVDINNATVAQLETLPGVGSSTAKKIVAGRPYTAVGDLAKAGVSAKVIQDVTPLVIVGTPSAAPAAGAKTTTAKAPKATPATSPTPGKPLDLNSASQTELETLPGVGATTAKKIIAARPFTAVGDLSKAGLSAKTITSITPLVTVGPAPAGAPAAAATTGAMAPATATATKPATTTGTPQVPPVKGMVWVNLSTKVYHKEGDPYYGNTKNGKFMTEADAIKAGYRLSKEGGGGF